jgi:hypothetical protein
MMNGAIVSSACGLGNVPTTYSIGPVGDCNGDDNSDLLRQHDLGDTSMRLTNGAAVLSTGSVGKVRTNWTVESVNAE